MKKIFFVLTLLIPFVLSAQDFPERPNPPRLVNDFADLLSSDEEQRLESKLVAYNDSTSTQIAIVTITSIGGYDAASYSFELGEKWGIGKKSKNNGLLILIAKESHDVFIAPGYGVEGYIPDAIAKRITEQTLVPAFKQGHFYEGLDEATDEMIARLSGVYKNEDAGKRKGKGSNRNVMIIIVIIIIILAMRRKGGGGGWGGGRGILFGSGMGWGGFSSGGFSSGSGSFGGGGGGFGGFGGGSFGGGGAGGKW
jgi:uncharacterized protein